MLRALIVLALSTVASLAIAEESNPTVVVSQSEAWTEAEANRPNMRTAPSFIDGPQAELPESEKALGHHGPVVIQGIIAIDGHMKEARVKASSGASGLDGIALVAANASTFVPAKDANGTPLPVVVSMPFDFVAYKAPGGMGALQYKCEQFVRDMDWWQSVNPGKSFKEHELYTMESGMFSLTQIQRVKGDMELLRQSIAEFENRWIAAIEYCRKKPDILQRDAIFR